MGFLRRLFGGKEAEKKPEKKVVKRKPRTPNFPLGDNRVSDADVADFEDLGRYFPLPSGYEYREIEGGMPAIIRQSDGKQYHFLIEADMLTFDDKYVTEKGKTAYDTVEVIKKK